MDVAAQRGALQEIAVRWAAEDPDPGTRAEMHQLLAQEGSELAERCSSFLSFGTAGLRGLVGAGPNRMNLAVVRKVTWGLAQALLQKVPEASRRGVIVGYDARLTSCAFAEETAGVLMARGIRAHLFAYTVPTPLVAFAVRHLGAAAGVMITASHNPRAYNGYKAYGADGGQIVPPQDSWIADHAAIAPPACAIPVLTLAEGEASGHLVPLGEPVLRAYLDAVRTLIPASLACETGGRAFSLAYTPLHGVAGALAARAFAEASFPHVQTVVEQETPDGLFPTVDSPNPEDPLALEAVLRLGREIQAELVCAHDPDGDRLAVALPYATHRSGYHVLLGNQIGVLLGHFVLTEGDVVPNRPRCVLASCVSSPMLGVLARACGVYYEETLTGCKWIAQRAQALEAEGMHFVFGYEEALGYMIGGGVWDKDGIAAGVLFAEWVAQLRRQGASVLSRWEELCRRYGVYGSRQVTRPLSPGGGTGASWIDRLRHTSVTQIGGYPVVAIRDLRAQTHMEMATGKVTPLLLPRSEGLIYDLVDGMRVAIRPSGTEPKVKVYLDVRELCAEGEPLEAAEARGCKRLDLLSHSVLAL